MKFVVTLLCFVLSSAFASTTISKESLVCLAEGNNKAAYLVSKRLDQEGTLVGIDILYTFKNFIACQNSMKTSWVEGILSDLPEVKGELSASNESCLYELEKDSFAVTGNVYRIGLQSDVTNTIKRTTLEGVYFGGESWKNFEKCIGDL